MLKLWFASNSHRKNTIKSDYLHELHTDVIERLQNSVKSLVTLSEAADVVAIRQSVLYELNGSCRKKQANQDTHRLGMLE
jgi:hypothetical protein